MRYAYIHVLAIKSMLILCCCVDDITHVDSSRFIPVVKSENVHHGTLGTQPQCSIFNFNVQCSCNHR